MSNNYFSFKLSEMCEHFPFNFTHQWGSKTPEIVLGQHEVNNFVKKDYNFRTIKS